MQHALKSLIKDATKTLKSLLVSLLKMQINNNPTEVTEDSNGYWLPSSTVLSHLEGVVCYLSKKNSLHQGTYNSFHNFIIFSYFL